MIFKNATIRNLRALGYAELKFDPNINLIVGVNGMGKSTILDALRIASSRILPLITESRSNAMSFSISDIKDKSHFLDIDIGFENNAAEFRYTRREWSKKVVEDNTKNVEKLRWEILNTERLRERPRKLLRELNESMGVEDTEAFFPSEAELIKSAGASNLAANCIFFGTARSVASDASASKSKTAGAEAAGDGAGCSHPV